MLMQRTFSDVHMGRYPPSSEKLMFRGWMLMEAQSYRKNNATCGERLPC